MRYFVRFMAASVLSLTIASPIWAQVKTGAGAGGTQATAAQMGAGSISQTPWFSNQAVLHAHRDQRSNVQPNFNDAYGQAYTTYNSGVSAVPAST